MVSPKRLEIYYARLEKKQGSVQYGFRPVLVVQNDSGNLYSESIIVVPLTTSFKRELPTHVTIGPEVGVKEKSVILCEQIMTVSLGQLDRKIGEITSNDTVQKIEQALAISIGLAAPHINKNRKDNKNESKNQQKRTRDSEKSKKED